MRFINPWMLVLVLLVPLAGVLWTYLRARSESRLRHMVAPALRKRLLPNRPKTFLVQSILIIAGLALCLLAAARPQWGRSSQTVAAKSRNVVVALDVSRSMLADDVRPNRLERAKALLSGSRLPLQEVALRTGFTSTNYFCRWFNKEMHMTPKTYRNRKGRPS